MSPLLIVILIVFIDLIGFSMVMPLLPRLAETRGYSDLQIGLIFAAYPMCQLISGPILGRLSDRYGRRPVLAVSQFGTALSFVILGLSHSFEMMLIGRMLDGASGGNFLVAQAYVADVSKPENRSKSLGLIGAAFGIGFVLGPLFAGELTRLPVSEEWKLRVPFLVAALFSTAAWVLVWLKLPESLPKDSAARQEARVVSWRGILDIVRSPTMGGLVLVGALAVMAFAGLEGTFSLFLQRRLGWNTVQAARGFALFGLVIAIVQGGLIRRLVPRFGEVRLILVGYTLVAAGFAGIAWSLQVLPLLLAVAVVGLGYGMAAPSVQGLLSRVTPASEQGAVFGTLASAQTLARIISYPVASVLMGKYGPGAPYLASSIVGCVTLLAAILAVRGVKLTATVPVSEELAADAI